VRSPSQYRLEATYAACNCLGKFGQLCNTCFGNHGNYQTEEEIDEALKHNRLRNQAYERSKGNVGGGGGSRIGQDGVGWEGRRYSDQEK